MIAAEELVDLGEVELTLEDVQPTGNDPPTTSTRAGARAVYETVGMVVTSTWVNRSITL